MSENKDSKKRTKVKASTFAEAARYTNHIQMIATQEGAIFEFRGIIPDATSVSQDEEVELHMDVKETPPHTRIFMPLAALLEFRNLLERNIIFEEAAPSPS